MCGIVAAASYREVSGLLLAGLKTLEYRGYDSAGLAMQVGDEMHRRRIRGKVQALENLLAQEPLTGTCGIAHTRWATHGAPSDRNAHPMMSGSATSGEHVALVHNGIIENHQELRTELVAAGYEFSSETDTEVMVHLVASHMAQGQDLFSAVQSAVRRLHGAYAIAVVAASEPNTVVGARRGSPMVLGLGERENFLASDIYPLLPQTRRFVYLEEGDLVRLDADSHAIVDATGRAVERPARLTEVAADAVQRGEYPHYMLKEIHEQPQVVAETLEGRLGVSRVLPNIFGVNAEAVLARTRCLHIVACGTAFHAGAVARYQIEETAGLPCMVEVASEYRYRRPVVPENCLFVTISQSGETADTLAALRHAKQSGYLATLAICNVPESSVVREADLVLMTRAGPEIGVASTKAFVTQLVALQLLQLELGRLNGMDAALLAECIADLHRLPELLNRALQMDPEIKALAAQFVGHQHALFLGRGSHYPIAMEGALKLKEISYIHAEAYPAGELKHGPLALVDQDMPVVAVAPNDELLRKLISNLEEVHARGGRLYVVADQGVAANFSERHGQVLQLDTGSRFLAPVVLTIPLQLLAYHVAVARGTDVDQPRNLAKSVTVE